MKVLGKMGNIFALARPKLSFGEHPIGSYQFRLVSYAAILMLAIAGSLAPIQAQSPTPHVMQPAERHGTLGCPRSPVDLRDLTVTAAPAGAHLTYFGGKIISNVKLVMVLYGSGTYASFISNDTPPSMVSFYQQLGNSSYLGWLCEYSTNNQSIGPGTYGGKFSITPSSANNQSTIGDANIQVELASQIAAGHLPAPDANTLYMVHFPSGKSIRLSRTSRSCVAGGFCAYHGTFFSGTSEIYYAILPDMSAGSGCDTGCGASAVPFNNQTSVASHEIIEAITDPEVGVASTFGPPLGWYDASNGEIGDICNAQQTTFVGSDGFTYTVQKGWSNHDGGCIGVRQVLPPLANAQSQVTHQGSPIAITLTGADTNVCPLGLTFSVVANPAHGTLTGLAPALNYIPVSSFFGFDTFQFKVNNGFLDSTPATVSISLVPTNITIARLADRNVRITFNALPGSPYRLQATDIVTNTAPWVTVLTTNSGPNTTLIFDDLQATNHPQRAYRTATP